MEFLWSNHFTIRIPHFYMFVLSQIRARSDEQSANFPCLMLFAVDITVYRNGYHGDLNETFYVGEVDEGARRLVQTTYECLMQAIDAGKTYLKHEGFASQTCLLIFATAKSGFCCRTQRHCYVVTSRWWVLCNAVILQRWLSSVSGGCNFFLNVGWWGKCISCWANPQMIMTWKQPFFDCWWVRHPWSE